MSCERLRKTLNDAVLGESSPELESHLSGCGSCRATLAAERALLDRIDAELQDALETQPSPAFVPGVRRRVAELRARRGTARGSWLVPTLAMLAGVLVAGHFMGEVTRGPTIAVPAPVRPAEPRPVPAVEPVEPAPGHALEPGPPATRREPRPPGTRGELAPPGTGRATAVAHSSRPRVLVPAEDERVVRRLARRLRGRAARAAVLAPVFQGSFDFMLEPLEGAEELVSVGRVLRGAVPRFDEPPSFDSTVRNTGRET